MKRKSNEDVVDVTGVRKSDSLLQVGSHFSFMKKFVGRDANFRDVDEVPYTEIYDKIFVNGYTVTQELVAKLCCINTGTITFFIDDKDEREKLAEMLETKWYPANVWSVDSNVGSCVITDAHGPCLKASQIVD